MPELFDMISGSETGAMIASTLVVASTDPKSQRINKYFANETAKFFYDNSDTLY